ncbi:hypothetical protein BJV74DRAFT_84021 [Russula compacta]|nr:hypothetical protein BJV74DRAFT_84021 [Russula compacta]
MFLNISRPRTPRVDQHYRYLGTYAKVPMVRTTLEADEWLSLPPLASRSSPPRTLRYLCVCVRISDGHPCCSVVMPGHGALSVQRPLTCAVSKLESVYATRDRMGPHLPPMKLTSGLRGIREGTRVSKGQLSWPHWIQAKRCKIGLEVVKCVGYDVQVTRRLQGSLA